MSQSAILPQSLAEGLFVGQLCDDLCGLIQELRGVICVTKVEVAACFLENRLGLGNVVLSGIRVRHVNANLAYSRMGWYPTIRARTVRSTTTLFLSIGCGSGFAVGIRADSQCEYDARQWR